MTLTHVSIPPIYRCFLIQPSWLHNPFLDILWTLSSPRVETMSSLTQSVFTSTLVCQGLTPSFKTRLTRHPSMKVKSFLLVRSSLPLPRHCLGVLFDLPPGPCVLYHVIAGSFWTVARVGPWLSAPRSVPGTALLGQRSWTCGESIWAWSTGPVTAGDVIYGPVVHPGWHSKCLLTGTAQARLSARIPLRQTGSALSLCLSHLPSGCVPAHLSGCDGQMSPSMWKNCVMESAEFRCVCLAVWWRFQCHVGLVTLPLAFPPALVCSEQTSELTTSCWSDTSQRNLGISLLDLTNT